VLQVGGIDVTSLSPQESESSSFGLEIAPESMPGFDFGLNYYKIRYTGLIATPGNGNALTLLANQAAYSNLIIKDPDVDTVNRYIGFAGTGFGTAIPNFTPALVDVIVDIRRRNLSVVRAEGVDLATNYSVKAGSSTLTFGVNGTYILNQEQQVTSISPEIDTVDTIFNPPDWRARGFIGWQLQGWAANVFVNHTDAYVDNRLVTRPGVDSYTTFDTRLAYDFSKRFSSGALSGLTIAFNAQNVLDKDPPRVTIVTANSAETGFDSTNADPLGRFLSLEITKVW
jgi:iron complex outermembrane receptor protein